MRADGRTQETAGRQAAGGRRPAAEVATVKTLAMNCRKHEEDELSGSWKRGGAWLESQCRQPVARY